jgi:hypothetical protein
MLPDAAPPLVAVEKLHKSFGPKTVLTGIDWQAREQGDEQTGPNAEKLTENHPQENRGAEIDRVAHQRG